MGLGTWGGRERQTDPRRPHHCHHCHRSPLLIQCTSNTGYATNCGGPALRGGSTTAEGRRPGRRDYTSRRMSKPHGKPSTDNRRLPHRCLQGSATVALRAHSRGSHASHLLPISSCPHTATTDSAGCRVAVQRVGRLVPTRCRLAALAWRSQSYGFW
jgi:hypothetical protein